MKTTIFKLTIICLLSFTSVQFASAQFSGKLVYEVVRTDSKLVMTYYQNKSNARIEAYSVRLNNDAPDMSTLKAQDTILYDLSKSSETHLQYRTQRAIISQSTFALAGNSKGYKNQVLDVKKVGQETVNGYSCSHFVLTSTMNGLSNHHDVWITKDLGPAPSIYVMGSYLYYTPGYLMLTKLIEAGGDGIVVKTVHGEGTFSATANLISADKKTPSASMFQVPSRYIVIDNSNMTLPTKPEK